MISQPTNRATPTMTYAPYRRLPGDTTQLPHVDVALVMESTYPYLKGGLSGVVHDIILNHPHLTFGIIFTTWDSSIELSPQYAVPSNVKWVDVIYLSFEENKEQFVEAVLTGQHPERAARALASALHNPDAMWELYDDYINPLTRTDSVWPALTSRTLMKAMCKKIPAGHPAFTLMAFAGLLLLGMGTHRPSPPVGKRLPCPYHRLCLRDRVSCGAPELR